MLEFMHRNHLHLVEHSTEVKERSYAFGIKQPWELKRGRDSVEDLC